MTERGRKSVFYVGVDLGKSRDHTAIAVLEVADVYFVERDPVTFNWLEERRKVVRYVERLPLGTAYTEAVDRVARVVAALPHGTCSVVVDATGVGAPVVEQLRKAGMKAQVVPVTITAAEYASNGDGGWRVPKKDLMAGLLVMMERGELKFSRKMAEAARLRGELESMEVKRTRSGGEAYEAGGSAKDDLVLATALAAWRANRGTVGEMGKRIL